MADNKNNKKANSSSQSQSKKKSSNNGGSLFSVNKWSFYTIGAIAVLSLLAGIFAAVQLSLGINLVSLFQSLATVLACAILAYSAFKYIRNKATVWKVLYAVFILVLLVGIILPICF